MILDWLEEWFKGVLIDGITSNLTGLFDTVNTKVGEIAADVKLTRSLVSEALIYLSLVSL